MSKQNLKVVAIIQARMGSTRLPGKVLMDIVGKPMAWRVVERVKYSKYIDEVVLAIPDTKENDVLVTFAEENDIIYVRGSENDVLSRYYKTAEERDADVVVRITADCPLIDPKIIDDVIQSHIKRKSGYASNVISRTFPRGLDVEVFNFQLLEEVNGLAEKARHREHVTLYMLENPLLSNPSSVTSLFKSKADSFRLTVDTKEDLELIQKIYEHFGETDFSTHDLFRFLDKNPDLVQINSHIKQKEFVNLRKAEEKDIEFLFKLRNEKYVYENSRVARKVGRDEHNNWSGPVIKGKTNKELFIIEYERERVGQLRLDYSKNEAEVSISIRAEFHGKGVGTRALLIAMVDTRNKHKVKVLSAEVNKNNPASQRLFEKVGFHLEGQEGCFLKYSFKL